LSVERRQAAWRRGRAAERDVAGYLEHRGATVIAQNLRIGPYEIDLVARENDVVLVVEVRTRGAGSWQSGFESVTPRKAQRVRRAGERLWRERFQRDATVNRMRFDVAAVTYAPDGQARIEYAAGVL
jgi:putative endonuclease